MTFGQIKTSIENNLLESYKNDSDFKKILREFKSNILNDKTMSKLYSLYDQLSTPQNLTEQEAKDFLNEGINLIQSIIPKIRETRSLNEDLDNNYKDIDTLVYPNNINIAERVSSRKNIISVLTTKKEQVQESINIPLTSMVKVANQTLNSYLETLDESSKKELIKVISEDSEKLKVKFDVLKEMTLEKLTKIKEQDIDTDTKNKVLETINKIELEEFNQLNYIKLKNLEKSI
jgi:rubrerythrin